MNNKNIIDADATLDLLEIFFPGLSEIKISRKYDTIAADWISTTWMATLSKTALWQMPLKYIVKKNQYSF